MTVGERAGTATPARRRLPVFYAVMVGALLSVSAIGVYRVLGTCQPLDRWLGRSGCKARIIIPEFRQLTLQAMALPRGQQTVSLFGTDLGTASHKPAMVRIALPGGEQQDRIPLPAEHITSLRVSSDGVRAMLDCSTFCNDKASGALLVSVADGQVIAALADQTAMYDPFPGEAKPPKSPIAHAVAVPGGKYVVKLSGDGKEIVLYAADDGKVIRQMPSGKVDAPSSPFFVLQPSPSGRLIASLDNRGMWPLTGSGSIIGIWDVESGQKRAAIQASDFYLGDVLWSEDESTVTVSLRTVSGGKAAVALDVFDWRSKAIPADRTPGSP